MIKKNLGQLTTAHIAEMKIQRDIRSVLETARILMIEGVAEEVIEAKLSMAESLITDAATAHDATQAVLDTKEAIKPIQDPEE